MPTWAEVQEYARSKYKLAEDKENSFKLVFEYDNQRLQAVIVTRFDSLNREWLDFSSACCAEHQLSAEDAVRRNYDFAVGAIALDKNAGVYIVRHTVQLGTMDMEEFEVPLHLVASTADGIEAEVAGEDKF